MWVYLRLGGLSIVPLVLGQDIWPGVVDLTLLSSGGDSEEVPEKELQTFGDLAALPGWVETSVGLFHLS